MTEQLMTAGMDQVSSEENTSGTCPEQSALRGIDPRLMAMFALAPRWQLQFWLYWLKRILSADLRRSEDEPRVRDAFFV